MEKIWGPGRNSSYCLFLSIPESSVDVNIHPNKTIVKFEESAIVFSLIQSSIETQTRDLEPFKSFDPMTTSFPTEAATLERQTKDFWQAEFEIMQITPQHFIVKKSYDEIYIFDADKAIKHIMTEKLDDDSLMPLLINIPFFCSETENQTKIINLLKESQLHSSSLNDQEILLFALHPDLSFFDYQEITRQRMTRKKDFDFSKMKSPLSSLENYIHKKGIEYLLKINNSSTFLFLNFRIHDLLHYSKANLNGNFPTFIYCSFRTYCLW